MADVTIKYKGSIIAEMSDTDSKTLETSGMYCEDNIEVIYNAKNTGGSYTNQIPISTDTDGSIYSDDGFAENIYLSSGGIPASRNDNCCTGFIPIGNGEKIIRMSKIIAGMDTVFRVATYHSDKSYGGYTFYGTQFDTNVLNVPIPYELDNNGNVTKFDLTAIITAVESANNRDIRYIRISCAHIDNHSVLTVNEEIKDDGIYVDVSNDTVTPETLAKGITAHDKTGKQITGTAPTASEIRGDNGFFSLSVVDVTVGANTVSGGGEAYDYFVGLAGTENIMLIALLDNPNTNNQLIMTTGSIKNIGSNYKDYRSAYRYNTSGTTFTACALYDDYNMKVVQGTKYRLWIGTLNTTNASPY